MLEYKALKKERRKFLALTGLTLKEFKALLPAFAEAYRRQYAGPKTLAGKKPAAPSRWRAARHVGGGGTKVVIHAGLSQNLSVAGRVGRVVRDHSVGG